MKLSACWIVKNEKEDIERSIQSVRGIVDELVVVDTGSSDGTRELAASLGARVVHFDWIGDFSAARNHALGQTSGEVVIMLDGDEWFVPALGPSDRSLIQRAFKSGQTDAAFVGNKDLTAAGTQMGGIRAVLKIFRGKGGVKFFGRVHEVPLRPNGDECSIADLTGLLIHHTGYAGPKSRAKALRNLEILKTEFEEQPTGADKCAKAFYLMRENLSLEDDEGAMKSLRWMLDSGGLIKDMYQRYPVSVWHFMPLAAALALRCRQEVSRAQFKKAVVDPLERYAKTYPAAALAGVHYEFLFAHSDATLLQALPAAAAKAEKAARGSVDHYLLGYPERLTALCTGAALACLRRGEGEAAMDWAVRAMIGAPQVFEPQAVHILLKALDSLPPKELLGALGKVVDLQNPEAVYRLAKVAMVEGRGVIYAVLIKRLMEADAAGKSDYLLSLIALGEGAKAAEVAADSFDEGMPERRRILFLAIACTGDKNLLARYGGEIGEQRPLLQALLEGCAAKSADTATLREYYPLVAFAAGRERANRFAVLFDAPEARFDAALDYYRASGLYAEFLAENAYAPAPEDGPRRVALAEMALLAGQDTAAWRELEGYLDKNPGSYPFFDLCAALAHRGNADAGEVYGRYAALYESWVDAEDLCHTGYVEAFRDEKKAGYLATLTPADFEALAAPYGFKPFHGQLEVYKKAAEICLDKQVPEGAFGCALEGWRFATGNQGARQALRRVFALLGNTALADYFA